MIRKTIIVILTLAACGSLLLVTVTLWLPVWRSYGSDADFLRILVADGVAELGYGYLADDLAVTQQRRKRLGKQTASRLDSRESRMQWGGLAWDVTYGGMQGGWSGGPRNVRCAGPIPVNSALYKLPLLVEPKPRTFTKTTINVVHHVRVPLWIPFVISAAYPSCFFALRAWRRHRRRRTGSCLDCGYDLTGNESGVCPECGTEVACERGLFQSKK